MSESELLPCPFCAAQPIIYEIEAHKHVIVDMPDHPGSWVIECPACQMAGGVLDTKEHCVIKWNTRKSPEDKLIGAKLRYGLHL